MEGLEDLYFAADVCQNSRVFKDTKNKLTSKKRKGKMILK
jgi:predicted DNA-binding protein